MKHPLLASSLCLLLACGADDALESDGPPGAEEQAKPRTDAGTRDAGSKKPDGGAEVDETLTPLPTDFDQCAASRTGAERGPRGSNVVWVIDTSGSMDEEAALVQQNLNRFVDSTVNAGLSDYRVVMVSERSFVNVPDPLRSDAAHFLYVEEKVGSSEPLEDLLSRLDSYQSFLLPNVLTHFVVVTDDESDLPASEFIAQMGQRLDGEFRVHTVASPPDGSNMVNPNDPFAWLGGLISGNGCKGPYGDASEPGVENFKAAAETGGLAFSICADDWTSLFSQLADEVSSSAVPCNLALPKAQNGAFVDTSLVNVFFTPAGGGKGGTIPRRDAKSACGTQQGWYYDDPKNPERIELCPTSCSAASEGGSLDIALGCITVVQ